MRPRRLAANSDRKRINVAYARVSSEQQAMEGISLEAQETRLRAYASGLDWELEEVVIDAAASAKSTDRPGLQKIMTGLRDRSIGRVIVMKLDRLTRSVRDLADILDTFNASDAALVSIGEHLDTSSASGRLMLNLLASVSQWEREAIGERTAAALSHKRSMKMAYGATPFGYRRAGATLIPHKAEQDALREAMRMDIEGASFREIAAYLTTLGLQPQRGKAWYASSVRAMLRSKMANADHSSHLHRALPVGLPR
jgi:site-specific DNA recombinase